MVEAPQDKIGGDKFEWKGCEMLFWYNMINKHKLFDPLVGCKYSYKGILAYLVQIYKMEIRELKRFYVHRDVFNFRKDETSVSVQVSPYTLLNPHPVIANNFQIGRTCLEKGGKMD